MKQAGRIFRWLLVLGLILTAVHPVRAEPEECDHQFVEHEVPGTCTDPGLRYWECSLCGMQYGYESTPPLGHNFDGWITEQPADCTHPGREKRTCLRCGESEQREIPPAGHRFEEETIPPTCTRSGSVRQVCSVCGKTEGEQSIPSLGHSYDGGVVTKAPTERAMGRRTFTCVRCGATKTEKIPRLPKTPRPPSSRKPKKPVPAQPGQGRLFPVRRDCVPFPVALQGDRCVGPDGNPVDDAIRLMLILR